MNYQKFKTIGVTGLFRHVERYKDENGNYIKFGNQNIDTTKTHLNYNLGPELEGTQFQRMQDRLEQLQFRKQKNNVVCCSWIVNAPPGMTDPEEQKRFFNRMHKFIQSKTGGPKNEISCYVHMDEVTPHMHYLFCPGYQEQIYDKDTNVKKFPYVRMTLSASKLTNREVLQNIHQEAQEVVSTMFPGKDYRMVAEEPEDRAKGSVKVEEYKAALESLEDKNKELTRANKSLQGQLDNARRELKETNEELSNTKRELGRAKGNLDSVNFLINKYNNDDMPKVKAELKNIKDDISKKKNIFGNLSKREQRQMDKIDKVDAILEEFGSIIPPELYVEAYTKVQEVKQIHHDYDEEEKQFQYDYDDEPEI
jgi:hypothetical protein